MKTRLLIVFLVMLSVRSSGQERNATIVFDFFGNPVELPFDPGSSTRFDGPPREAAIQVFRSAVAASPTQPLISALLQYKKKLELNDWLYYQLIRKTAQQISPKADNYYRYTLYKWFLLTGSGYDATLKTDGNKLLFYVQSDENIYNIPSYMKQGKQYVCLNYHDYGSAIDFEKESFIEINLAVPGAQEHFSYKITRLPDFKPSDYQEKDLAFSYNQDHYQFRVKLNPQIKTLFANYPVVDYESFFNIPLSSETYRSLIPRLREQIKGMNTKNGIDYLLHFTRYAFLYGTDTETFGREKRLSPEQTLLYEKSDCEDRAAFFFFLVKELYDLPMIVLAYPEHVTIAVKFTKPIGTPIVYNGSTYSVCEPTPQKKDLKVGQLLPGLEKEAYEVVYAYMPSR